MNGSPAASMSIAIAGAPVLLASAIFSRTVAVSHGFTVGIPQPPAAAIVLVARCMIVASTPSPVNARMPAFFAAGMRMSLYSASPSFLP